MDLKAKYYSDKNKFLSYFIIILFIMVFILYFIKVTDFDNKIKSSKESNFPSFQIEQISPIRKDILAIYLKAGEVIFNGQKDYQAQPGDEIIKTGYHRWIMRDDEIIGALVGKDNDKIFVLSEVKGVYPNSSLPSDPQQITLEIHQAKKSYSIHPLKIFKKTYPTNLIVANVLMDYEAPLEHVLYLQLPEDLKENAEYKISFGENSPTYTHNSQKSQSESVHVSQVGFRPDDPKKIAFLSGWLGDGGPIDYAEGIKFEVINEENSQAVFNGSTQLASSKDQSDDVYDNNYAGVDVYYMDFSDLQEPGDYRVCVRGIGCSFPFPIAKNVWQEAFQVSVKGLYHQRSGIELDPSYSDFSRPRSFHPDDGVVVYASNVALMDTRSGLNPENGTFKALVSNKTNQVLPEAWGGTMDAGDWDRRIQHLKASRFLLELAELFPEFVQQINLNIPESNNQLPDIVDEALWNVDFYKRLQTPEGGIRGGIESSEHPRYGEMSWQESLTVIAYAPGVWSSYLYAGVAARASEIVRPFDQVRADNYLQSAFKAMSWAEQQLPRRPDDDPHQVNDARNLAAAELYKATGQDKWHQLFLKTTVFTDPDTGVFKYLFYDQADAAWVYVNTDYQTQLEVVENCQKALIEEANQRKGLAESTSYRFTKGPYAPISGNLSNPSKAVPLIRAHALTGQKDYLSAIILASQTGAGANPLNISYTTGIGIRNPENVLHIDSYYRNLPPPTGLTVLGPLFYSNFKSDFQGLESFIYPTMEEWPTAEFFFDAFWLAKMTEYTIQFPMAGNMYVWGYLAARN